MKRTCSSLLPAAVFAMVITFSPAGAGAKEVNVPKDYPTINAAITALTTSSTGTTSGSGGTVVVAPGTYQETITLKNNIAIRGSETARTFLSGNGGGPIVTADGATISTSIRNFTFVNASSGIKVSNNAAINIESNVFQVGTGGFAVTIQNAPLTGVINNTFYQNGTALTSDTLIKIINNIFANNTTAIAGLPVSATNITYNAFFGNSANGPTGANTVTGDPLFVDTVNHDFHLKEGSPCIDVGNPDYPNSFDNFTFDIGAYGGPSADPIPFPVAGLTITATTASSIDLTWSPNNSYLVTGQNATGGYFVYYGYASGKYNGTDANGGDPDFASPINVGSDISSYTLMDLNPSAKPLSTPVLDHPSPRDGQLVLAWSAVDGATGYQVHYGKSSIGEYTIDVGNATSYVLSGLTNGQTYRVAVTAYARPTYFIVVTAYDSMFVDTATTPEHESAYSPEVSAQLGPTQESALSNIETDYPEPITPYPVLPNSSGRCFIATAAYGDYSAPEVQALRSFRDRYLLTSAPGRMFVEWYYRNGPAAAALLNAHAGYKPAVRAALLPAVGVAIFMTRTSMAMKAGVLLVFGAALAFSFTRKRRQGTGGLR